ncbi:MAG: hypothetical protein A4S09_14420 [Proteobacteria bacterium SG_bin7]|nr:MAG: hypothetical protein A4S09_14420 [Proteobacteria bacterium SG_bin7]
MKVYVRAILLGFIVLLVGCKRPMKDPETIDPIYGDLLKEMKFYESQVKKFADEAEATRLEMEKEDPRTGNAKAIKSRYYGKLRDAETAKQMMVFYELHAKTRKKEARESYLVAFKTDRPWPDPKEYEAFQTRMALRKANRSWDSRTKKWSARLEEIKKAAKIGESGGKPEGETTKGH